MQQLCRLRQCRSREAPEPGDLPSLAGKWQGWARGTAIGSRSVEMTIHPDGSFVSLTTGADQVQGRMAIIDGKAELRGKATGPTASPTSSTATLYERNGKRILSGEGRTPYGLYTYELEAVR